MDVKKIAEGSRAAREDDGMEHGTRQAFAVFAMPGSAGLFATPVGSIEGDQEAYFTDLLFFYDAPQTIYSNWPKDVWVANRCTPGAGFYGMSELETRPRSARRCIPKARRKATAP